MIFQFPSELKHKLWKSKVQWIVVPCLWCPIKQKICFSWKNLGAVDYLINYWHSRNFFGKKWKNLMYLKNWILRYVAERTLYKNQWTCPNRFLRSITSHYYHSHEMISNLWAGRIQKHYFGAQNRSKIPFRSNNGSETLQK